MGFMDKWMGGESLGAKLSKGAPGLIAALVFAIVAMAVYLVLNGIAAQATADAVKAGTIAKGARLGLGHWSTTLTEVLHINQFLLLLIVGILIRNTIGVPKSLLYGLGMARPIIKPGIIFLGAELHSN